MTAARERHKLGMAIAGVLRISLTLGRSSWWRLSLQLSLGRGETAAQGWRMVQTRMAGSPKAVGRVVELPGRLAAPDSRPARGPVIDMRTGLQRVLAQSIAVHPSRRRLNASSTARAVNSSCSSSLNARNRSRPPAIWTARLSTSMTSSRRSCRSSSCVHTMGSA